MTGTPPIIWPPVHNPETVKKLLDLGLWCLRPGCGCTTWWQIGNAGG